MRSIAIESIFVSIDIYEDNNVSVLNQLASALGRRDEVPNQELAQRIAKANDAKAVEELAKNLKNKDKDIASDCIKTLQEAARINPELIAPYYRDFLDLLTNKNNRLVWGAMQALDAVAGGMPKMVYDSLPLITLAAKQGSVITKDHAVSILVKLARLKKYHQKAFELLMGEIVSAPVNQLPTYAEHALTVVSDEEKPMLLKILRGRLWDDMVESKRKRLDKTIKKLSAKS
jgi:hypothetical protein